MTDRLGVLRRSGRVRAVTDRVARTRWRTVAGSIDRCHDGLVTGWLACPACAGRATVPQVEVRQGQVHATVPSTVPRPDVPGGRGFAVRRASTGAAPIATTVACARHPARCLSRAADDEEWRTPLVGRLERADQDVVSGWFLRLDEPDDSAVVDFSSGRSCVVTATHDRPDVSPHVGSPAVALGFSFSPAARFDLALQPGQEVLLRVRGRAPVDRRVLEVLRRPPGPSVVGGPVPSAGRTSAPQGSGGPAALPTRLLGPPSSGRSPLPTAVEHALALDPVTRDWYACVRLHLADDQPREVMAYLEGLRSTGALRWPLLDERVWARLNTPSGGTSPDRPSTLLQRMHAEVRGPEPAPGDWLRDFALWCAGFGNGDQMLTPEQREALGRRASEVAPVPLPASAAGVCVVGMLDHPSGLGSNAATTVRAAREAGEEVSTLPVDPRPHGWNPALVPGAPEHRSLEGQTVVVHFPLDRVPELLSAQPELLRAERLIGCFVWETDVLPRELWAALDLVDEVWTATPFVADAFRAVTMRPCEVVGHEVDTGGAQPADRAALGIPDDCFVVHYSFDAHSSLARKNPLGALRAFQTAFPADRGVRFLLKVRNHQHLQQLAGRADPSARALLDAVALDDRVVLVGREVPRAEALSLMALSDCYLSLHRSEGFGYTTAEAMSLGLPVVASRYSGNLSYMDDAGSWLVGGAVRPVLPGEYFHWSAGMRWFEPDVLHAAEQLRAVRAGGPGTTERCASGLASVTRTCAPSVVARRYAAALARS